MLWDIRQIIVFLHILLAITWVGGVFFIGWGVVPAIRKEAYTDQRRFLLALMQWSHSLLTGAGGGVIATGILLGTVFGPISRWNDIWHTYFGTIWMMALVVGILTLFWGVWIGFRYSIGVLSDAALWEAADNGDTTPLFRALAKAALLESVEVAGFVTLIVLMVFL
ncbi:hypothetical protein GCM10008983_25300 [Lentibacillus halophilus]|uniref:Copper resistance protein D n=1 Tax=Lentibacillus halophilus TaxID=295065 RepID=A0ABN0ZFZ0_9BACI